MYTNEKNSLQLDKLRDILSQKKCNHIFDKKMLSFLSTDKIENEDFCSFVEEFFLINSGYLIQIKINIEDKGYFLIGMDKAKISFDKYNGIINEFKKIRKILRINFEEKISNCLLLIDKCSPLYCFFYKKNNCSFDLKFFEKRFFSYPFLLICGEEKNIRKKTRFFEDIECDFFIFEKLFLCLNVAFYSFSLFSAISYYLLNASKSFLLFLLNIAFFAISSFFIHLSFFQDPRKIDLYQKIHFLIFVIFGISIGSSIGYSVSINTLHLNVEDSLFVLRIVFPCSILASILSLLVVVFINFAFNRKFNGSKRER